MIFNEYYVVYGALCIPLLKTLLRIMGRGLVILHLHFALFVCYLLDSKYTYNIHMFTTKNSLDEGNKNSIQLRKNVSLECNIRFLVTEKQSNL